MPIGGRNDPHALQLREEAQMIQVSVEEYARILQALEASFRFMPLGHHQAVFVRSVINKMKGLEDDKVENYQGHTDQDIDW